MKKTTVLISTVAMMALILVSTSAMAETRLYVPQFRFSDSEDTQFLIANQNDRDTTVDLWAFTSSGELLGEFQMPVKAHGTKSLTLGEALRLKGASATGWIGAVSRDDGIQLTYTRIDGSTALFEAQEWTSREVALNVSESGKSTVRLSNPNPFAASLTITGTDHNGRYVGTEQVSVRPFGQIELPSSGIAGGRAAKLQVASNADVVAVIDAETERPAGKGGLKDSVQFEDLAIVIDSTESIGAYQVSLTFDPALAQFSAKDIDGGSAEGFDSKPLVVNIDNAAGQITIASFQVGSHPGGRVAVARLKAPLGIRFGIQVDEITDTTGKSLPGLSVGMVRAY